MQQVSENLFVGAGESCDVARGRGMAIVHACKIPCHQAGVGYRNSLPSNHPSYLIHASGNQLYLNMIDNDRFEDRFARPMINAALDFLQQNTRTGAVLIHCNQGMSRSPMLALVFLAKRAKILPNENYDAAKTAFQRIYPGFNPGAGVDNYLRESWASIS